MLPCPRREVCDVHYVGTCRGFTFGVLFCAKIRTSVTAGTNSFPGPESFSTFRRTLRPFGPRRKPESSRSTQMCFNDKCGRRFWAVWQTITKLCVNILADANTSSVCRSRISATSSPVSHAEVTSFRTCAPLGPGGPLAVLGAVGHLEVAAVAARAAIGRCRAITLPFPADAVVAGGFDPTIWVGIITLVPA